ncbi:MAG: DUF2254 domain-containing protein [Parasphingorhabdus sp.]|uniref:DUF2254 domain-containing protein n=1 Tax=Parasphingorhabdus sp. TaxID=2709688 RepID=UPI003001245E
MLAFKKFIFRLPERIWFRALLFCLAAIVAVVAARWIGPLIPYNYDLELASGSVGDLLTILASSMLAVIAFSVSIMIAAYSSATNTATPRTITLMLADDRSQNALSTFLGTFLFSIVGIIGLSANFYGDKGRVLLFFATIAVIIIITGTLISWIQQLSTFGRMRDLIERVEKAASKALKWHGENPYLGAEPAVAVPEDAVAVSCETASGLVTTIDMAALQEAADKHDVTVHLAVYPGQLIYPARELLYLEGGEPLEIDPQPFRDTILIERDRSFEQDPRFGLVVLSEIASRALSPAVNDPGTAIAVINSGLRCFEAFAETRAELSDPDVRYSRLHCAEIELTSLFDDFFTKIARDGRGNIEVQQRIQLVLLALKSSWPEIFSDTADDTSRDALVRAESSITHEKDINDLKARSRKVVGANK